MTGVNENSLSFYVGLTSLAAESSRFFNAPAAFSSVAPTQLRYPNASTVVQRLLDGVHHLWVWAQDAAGNRHSRPCANFSCAHLLPL